MTTAPSANRSGVAPAGHPAAPGDDPLLHPHRRRHPDVVPVGRVPHAGEPAQPGPTGGGDRAHRAAHDADHHHRRHRPLGRFDRRPDGHHDRRGLAQLGPAPGAGHRRRPRHRDRLWRLQRLLHHPRRPAAADHHAGHAGAVPRPGRGHRPGAVGARLPGLVLHPRPEGPRFLGNATVFPNQLFLVVIGIIGIGAALAWTPFGRSLYAIGNNETGARFSGMPVRATSSSSTRCRASCPDWPAGSSSRASARLVPTWATGSS